MGKQHCVCVKMKYCIRPNKRVVRLQRHEKRGALKNINIKFLAGGGCT